MCILLLTDLQLYLTEQQLYLTDQQFSLSRSTTSIVTGCEPSSP